MDKIVFFETEEKANDFCKNQLYFDFIDYAFSRCNYFMLVYVNYYGNGYTKMQTYYKDALKKFKVKSRSNPSWPGTLKVACPNTTYKVVFYKTTDGAKKILKEAKCLNAWQRGMPEDLAFFDGNQCWFYSVGHENIAGVIHANNDDLDFLESKKLTKRENAKNHINDYYDLYDEDIE